MAIKKQFQDIVNFLTANQGKKVSTILDEVKEMCEAKAGGGGKNATTFHKNDAGEIIGLKCYYFKRWFSPKEKAFGLKKNSSSGFNSMCKEGNSLWTKQQSEYNKGKDQLLADVASGEIAGEDVTAALAELEAAKNVVEPTTEGYETLEELLAHLETVDLSGVENLVNDPKPATDEPVVAAGADEPAIAEPVTDEPTM